MYAGGSQSIHLIPFIYLPAWQAFEREGKRSFRRERKRAGKGSFGKGRRPSRFAFLPFPSLSNAFHAGYLFTFWKTSDSWQTLYDLCQFTWEIPFRNDCGWLFIYLMLVLSLSLLLLFIFFPWLNLKYWTLSSGIVILEMIASETQGVYLGNSSLVFYTAYLIFISNISVNYVYIFKVKWTTHFSFLLLLFLLLFSIIIIIIITIIIIIINISIIKLSLLLLLLLLLSLSLSLLLLLLLWNQEQEKSSQYIWHWHYIGKCASQNLSSNFLSVWIIIFK